MADVFISYHEKSAGELAAQIAAALESAEISCWYAKRDIPPGGDFARYIPPQIDACKVFLLILNDSVVHQSNHIENELGLAFGRFNKGEEITILPLEIGDFKRETWIRYYLVHTQSIKIPLLDYTHTQELVKQIDGLLKTPTPEPTNKQTPTPQLPPDNASTTTFHGNYYMYMDEFLEKARAANKQAPTPEPSNDTPSKNPYERFLK